MSFGYLSQNGEQVQYQNQRLHKKKIMNIFSSKNLFIFINQLSFNLCNISLNFRSGRVNCKSYSAEDRSSIENEDDDLHDDIGDDQVRLK